MSRIPRGTFNLEGAIKQVHNTPGKYTENVRRREAPSRTGFSGPSGGRRDPTDGEGRGAVCGFRHLAWVPKCRKERDRQRWHLGRAGGKD